VSPVATEKLLILVEQGITQSADDPLPILFVNPKDPEGFQPLLFLDRTLSHDQWDDLYIPISIYHQSPEAR
jgi:hypothetical protein